MYAYEKYDFFCLKHVECTGSVLIIYIWVPTQKILIKKYTLFMIAFIKPQNVVLLTMNS